jgi:hypothetical protein
MAQEQERAAENGEETLTSPPKKLPIKEPPEVVTLLDKAVEIVTQRFQHQT